MATSPATALPPDSKSPSMNSTSPPLHEASTPPPMSAPLPSSPPPSFPPPSSPSPSLPPPSSPPPLSPPPLRFSPPPPASSPPPLVSTPPPQDLSPPPPLVSTPPPQDLSPPPPLVSTPPPQDLSPPPPDSSLPAPIFLSPPPLSPKDSNTPSPLTLPPPLPSPPTPPSSSKGSSPPPPTFPAPSLSSPTPSSSFKPPPSSSDDFLPPPPPKRAAEAPSSHSPPLTNNGNVHSNKSSAGSDVNLPMVAGIFAGIALFFFIIGIVACVCCLKKKKKMEKKKINYYPDPGVKGGDYYNMKSVPPKWNNGGQDVMGKLPPPPGMAWNASPTPPAINSENSVNYSGPNDPPLQSSPSITLGFIKSTFSYEELAAATNGFSAENILGQGGFGYVHKGVLSNGQEVAVKQLKAGSGQGEREFQAEVEIISRVHHRHLVSLVGYCIVGSQRLLVYEFVPNMTLEFHLHGKNQPTMDWPTRMRIALGSAKGLAYLHEDCHPRIIHRDIKASNILLDYRFEAKVADFGLAKLSSDNYTHISTRVMGTFGYLAPEYASSGKLSEKSDVFSFGVMLLELITGKRPVHNNPMEDSLVDWAKPLLIQALTDENYDELVDPRLEGNYGKLEMAQMVACAATSVRHSAKMRPKMSQIVRALEGDSSLEDLTEGVKPGQSRLFTSSSELESGSYASNMSRFRRAPFDSNELSQEYSGGLTSDYGLNPSSSSSSGEISTVMPHPDRDDLQ